jgi:hypothetical protein
MKHQTWKILVLFAVLTVLFMIMRSRKMECMETQSSLEPFIKECINKAENYQSKLTDDILNMEGMSGLKTRHFYNNLLEYPEGARYLEIGTWKGSSVCSAMYKNENANVTCIDDFSEFEGPKQEFLNNFEKYKITNSKFIDSNCWNVDLDDSKFNFYLYDGAHEYEDHYKAISNFIKYMENEFVFLVDDWNLKRVRDGTFDAIRDLGLSIKFKQEILLTNDDSHTPSEEARNTWHNGIGIFILLK